MFKRQILHGHWGSEKSFKGWNPGLCAYICCTRVGGLCLDLRHCSVHALTQGLYGQCPLLFLLLFRSFRLTYYHPLSLNLIITILLIITLHYIITYYILHIIYILYYIYYIYIYTLRWLPRMVGRVDRVDHRKRKQHTQSNNAGQWPETKAATATESVCGVAGNQRKALACYLEL